MPIRITLPGRKSRLMADNSGAAAMEFALLLPLLTLMLTGVWQYGTMFYTYNTMTTSARDGARALANGSATEAQVRDTMIANLPGWIPATSDVRVVAQSNATANPANVVTQITVPAADAALFRFGPMPEDIVASVTMERET